MTTFNTDKHLMPTDAVVSANGDVEVAERLPEGIERVSERRTQTVATEGLVHGNTTDHAYNYIAYARSIKESHRSLEVYLTGNYTHFSDAAARIASYYPDHHYHLISVPAAFAGGSECTYIQEEYTKWRDMNPWSNQDWFRDNWLRWVEHFPAPSQKVSGLLSYFQNPTKRAANIRTPMKAGKYLQKFFGDILTQEEIQKYAMEWNAAFAPQELHIVTTPEDIVAVYQNAYNGSCMHFGNNQFAGSKHPAYVFGAGDLGQAYIGTLDTKDGVKGRCLVWPDKKLYYPKYYGDYHRLEAALVADGWTAGDESDFDGARLLRIEHNGAFVMTYSDTHDQVRDDGDFLRLEDNGGIECRQTNGLTADTDEGRETCGYDGGRYDEEEMTYVDGYGNVYDGNLREGPFFECSVRDEWFHNEDRAASPDGYPVSNRAAGSRRTFFCDATEMHYPKVHFNYVTLADGTVWESDYADDNALQCAFSEEFYAEDDITMLADGTLAHVNMDSSDFREWLKDNGHVEYTNWVNSDPSQLDLLAA